MDNFKLSLSRDQAILLLVIVERALDVSPSRCFFQFATQLQTELYNYLDI